MLWMFFQDALFSAIAAIGFAAVSRPARRAYIFCALLAAIGHSARFLLIDASGPLAMNIIPASFIAAYCRFAGCISVAIGKNAGRDIPVSCFAANDPGSLCMQVFWRIGDVHPAHR